MQYLYMHNRFSYRMFCLYIGGEKVDPFWPKTMDYSKAF